MTEQSQCWRCIITLCSTQIVTSLHVAPAGTSPVFSLPALMPEHRRWVVCCDPNHLAFAVQARLLMVILTRTSDEILLQSNILALEGPTESTLDVFRRWYSPKFQGTAIPVLGGRDGDLLVDHEDLVALALVDQDRLNRFLRHYFGWVLQGM